MELHSVAEILILNQILFMKVYKFGGASVKDAAGIRNLSEIVSLEKDNLVVVVSAFGKTTNALEIVLKVWRNGSDEYKNFLDNVYKNHISIIILRKAKLTSHLRGLKSTYYQEKDQSTILIMTRLYLVVKCGQQ
jgi:aspartokinase